MSMRIEDASHATESCVPKLSPSLNAKTEREGTYKNITRSSKHNTAAYTAEEKRLSMRVLLVHSDK